jgi:hypothetical protein
MSLKMKILQLPWSLRCPLVNIPQPNSQLHLPKSRLTDHLELRNSTAGSESDSFVTTDGQSASLSWNKAPIWNLRPDFYYSQTVAGLLMWGGGLPLTRGRVCRLQLLLAFASVVILKSVSLGTRDHILLSQILDFPFCRLLRLAWLRWKYSILPPHPWHLWRCADISPSTTVI